MWKQMYSADTCSCFLLCTSQKSEGVLKTDTLQLHIVKNWLVDNGWLDKTVRVPLILGIWGGKGQGGSIHQDHLASAWHACSSSVLSCVG